MSKIYCKNGGGEGNKNNPAVKECDVCQKPMCMFCGYVVDEKDYCNDCYRRICNHKIGEDGYCHQCFNKNL